MRTYCTYNCIVHTYIHHISVLPRNILRHVEVHATLSDILSGADVGKLSWGGGGSTRQLGELLFSE